MSFTEPVDNAKLRHWQTVWLGLRAFVCLDTKRLIDLSEWRDINSRLGLTLTLFSVASTLMILASSRFYPSAIGTMSFLNWSIGAMAAFSGLAVIPPIIGYKLLKTRRFFFITNIMLIQQSLISVAVISAVLVLFSQPLSKIDFTLLREGRGEETIAYQQFCGGLEASAELIRLNDRAASRSAAGLRRLEDLYSFGPPTEGEFLHQFSRMKSEMRGMRRDSRRIMEILQERNDVERRFIEAYPTYFMAIDLFRALFLFIVMLSGIHLARSAILGDRGTRTTATAIFAIVFSLTMAIAFAWVIGSKAEFPFYSKVDVPTQPVNQPASLDYFRQQQSELLAELEWSKMRLRAEVFSMRNVCPNINTRGVL